MFYINTAHTNTAHTNPAQSNTVRRAPKVSEGQVPNDLKLTLVGADWSCPLQQPIVIGRDAGCELRIEDAHVESRHAEIYPVGTQWWLRDLGTEDGTFVQGEIVEAEPLGTPCEIRLGAAGPTLRLDRLTDSLPTG